MGVLFSAVTVTAEGKEEKFLMGGIPKTQKDLVGWIKCEKFLDGIDENSTVKVHAEAHIYGEGETVVASPEEVAYFMKRLEMRSDFLEARCISTESIDFSFTRSQQNQFGGNTMSKHDSLSEQAKRYREAYPPGTRLELIHMDDPYAPIPSGTKGTVDYVDDAAQIHMKWDNGRTLALIPGEDSFRRIEEPTLAEEVIVELGDECKIAIPNHPIDCSKLGFFDELEEECWNLMKNYCATLGIKMLPDEDGNIPISFDIAKEIQDTILVQLDQAGVKMDFDGDIGEGETNTPVMGM